jgi:hypothetical protein
MQEEVEGGCRLKYINGDSSGYSAALLHNKTSIALPPKPGVPAIIVGDTDEVITYHYRRSVVYSVKTQTANFIGAKNGSLQVCLNRHGECRGLLQKIISQSNVNHA